MNSSDISSVEPIRCILSDVDGVMTDGRIIYDSSGVETKQFHVRDGLAIKAWIKSGFHFGIITARSSPMVDRRAKELTIQDVQQGRRDKWEAAQAMMQQWGVTKQQACYIGDDLPDLSVMRRVALAACPADAAMDVLEASHWVLTRDGGQGAIRELIERILRAKNRWEEHVPAN